ncbi:PRTRC system protein F [Caballeronia sp. LjRoot34]|uniref:PRTRC system protein F n=1 Tax=Caballeronia sp. LjRoot34 TaxID=3342325 RepID=UPI003ECD9501
MTFAPLALPSLADVPAVYTIRSAESFSHPLALSLLDSGVIAESDVRQRPKSAIALIQTALSRRWEQITEGMNLFDWHLRIEQAPEHGFPQHREEHLWALIQTANGPVSCREILIGRGMEKLEAIRAGLGQTVLATLQDAFGMLPSVCTPSFTLSLAEYLYWYGETDEQEAMTQAAELHGYDSVEEMLESNDFFTRAQFFDGMPEWAAAPRRVLTRRQIVLAAGRDPFAREVVDAMNTVWNIARFYGPFADVRSEDVGADLIDFGLIVRWSGDDIVGRVVDDYLHQASEGEYVIASSVTPLKIVGADIADWLKRMESTALLAKAVEHVLSIFDRDEFQSPPARVQVRV